nr:phosphoenolpyruvate carboxykinase (GTP) [Planctomycetota bacterium]
DVWWEGLTEAPPARLIDWQGRPWTPKSARKAAHANARYTTPASHCPVIDPRWQDPQGVPISAVLFGGRRAGTVPLVNEALSWEHGVFLGSTCASETTAAAAGAVGQLRRDPFAMLPFCGYHIGDYFAHWLDMGRRLDASRRPRLYYVNWFRRGADGGFLWPGFGDNVRVLKWIADRLDGRAPGRATEIGVLPAEGELDLRGLDLPSAALRELFAVDREGWRAEASSIANFYSRLSGRLPPALRAELAALRKRLGSSERMAAAP